MNAIVKEAVKVPREVEIVEMSDGRKVEFVGKRKMLKNTFIEKDQVTIRIDFRNGETRSWGIPEALILQCAGHGAEQKLGDEVAGETDVDDMTIAIDELIDRLNKLEWSVRREGGGFTGTSILMKALMEVSGKAAEAVKEFLKGKSQAEKMALRQSKTLKPVVERMEGEKVSKAAHIDAEALLATL